MLRYVSINLRQKAGEELGNEAMECCVVLVSAIQSINLVFFNAFVCRKELASFPGPHAERGSGPSDTWQNSRMC